MRKRERVEHFPGLRLVGWPDESLATWCTFEDIRIFKCLWAKTHSTAGRFTARTLLKRFLHFTQHRCVHQRVRDSWRRTTNAPKAVMPCKRWQETVQAQASILKMIGNITWRFLDKRVITKKYTKDVRLDSQKDELKYSTNTKTLRWIKETEKHRKKKPFSGDWSPLHISNKQKSLITRLKHQYG